MYNLLKNSLLLLFLAYHMEVPCRFMVPTGLSFCHKLVPYILNFNSEKNLSLPNIKILIFYRKCSHLVIKKSHNKEGTEYHEHTHIYKHA